MGVWIDTDMGADDIFAIQMVNGTKMEIDGVSLCFGVTHLEQVKRNTAGATDVFNWKFPIFAGSNSSIIGKVETAERVLGKTGIRTRGLQIPKSSTAIPDGACQALVEWLEVSSDSQILALGPLTNLATLVLNRPDMASRIGRVTWMGGSETGGNHTQFAEFNALADPEALAILLEQRVPLRMIDLDACRKVQITSADMLSIDPRSSLRSRLNADLFGGYLDIGLRQNRNSMALYDPVAAAAIVRPELFEFRPVQIEIDTTNALTRGQTRIEDGLSENANAQMVARLNAERIRLMCRSALENSN